MYPCAKPNTFTPSERQGIASLASNPIHLPLIQQASETLLPAVDQSPALILQLLQRLQQKK